MNWCRKIAGQTYGWELGAGAVEHLAELIDEVLLMMVWLDWLLLVLLIENAKLTSWTLLALMLLEKSVRLIQHQNLQLVQLDLKGGRE